MKRTRAFTLVEMLLAAVLTAVLVGGVMSVSSALARDARRVGPRMRDTGAIDAALEMIRWDLTNASAQTDDLSLTGHGGIDGDTLRPNGRLARVTYRIDPGVGLMREQRYLDDPVRPEPWSELILVGATEVEMLNDARGASIVRIQLGKGASASRVLMR